MKVFTKIYIHRNHSSSFSFNLSTNKPTGFTVQKQKLKHMPIRKLSQTSRTTIKTKNLSTQSYSRSGQLRFVPWPGLSCVYASADRTLTHKANILKRVDCYQDKPDDSYVWLGFRSLALNATHPQHVSNYKQISWGNIWTFIWQPCENFISYHCSLYFSSC